MEANNMAAMREALVYADRVLRMATEDNRYGDDVVYLVGCMRTVAAACRAALSAPPRNCDVYTTEDAVDTATVTVRDECDGCPSLDMEAPCVFCMVRWLLAPAKKGGAK